MAGAGEGGPVRLAILLVSLAGLLALGIQTVGDHAAASHRLTGAHGKIVALPARRRVPGKVWRLLDSRRIPLARVARLHAHVTRGAALILDGSLYLVGGLVHGSPTRAILRFEPRRRAVVLAGRLPVPASGGKAVAVRTRRAYLVHASVPGGTRLNFVISLRPPWTDRHRASIHGE